MPVGLFLSLALLVVQIFCFVRGTLWLKDQGYGFGFGSWGCIPVLACLWLIPEDWMLW